MIGLTLSTKIVMERSLTKNCVRAPISNIYYKVWLIHCIDAALSNNNGRKIIFCSRRKNIQAHWSAISRHAIFDQHGKIPREHLCMYLSKSFRIWPPMTFVL